MQSNLLIDINVFRACIETKVKKVIYTSSCAVYPMRRQQYLGTIFSEEDSEIVDPDGGYGLAKLIGEKQLMWMHDIKVGIVRFFNVYGVGENNHAVSDLIRKAIAYPEKKFEVFGGQQTRDFVYVDDCVDAMITLGNNVGESPIVVNIGSGQATSIKGLAEKIIKISGKDIVPKYVDIPIRQFSRTGNISRAKKVLNWEPQVSLDEGLKRTYGWLQNYSTNLH
jgi:nucleoside-diphosphate-sugar epimerase